ncbi:MAG TPA: hypothetical protein VEC13_01665 [Candidatus Paceibacterota bacterium]|nr:hypothetical protein [Candidatus Paceibacterota bacterium]
MKPINQIKLSLTISILVIIIPLTGFPQSFKTIALVSLGIILLYVKVVALHNEKTKKVRKAPVSRKAQVFVESKPEEVKTYQPTEEEAPAANERTE